MSDAAQKQVLITHIGTYLGVSLAKSLVSSGYQVWGTGASQSIVGDLLSLSNFTFCEIDLAQPLPHHLPKFDFIFHLELLEKNLSNLPTTAPFVSPATKRMIAQAREGTAVVIGTPLNVDPNLFDRTIKVFLIGDLYGPKMPLQATNELANLITQAVTLDKIILEKEGLRMIYPTYIADAVLAINKLAFSASGHVQVVVSEAGMTALSAAYQIQNCARLVLGRELGLFFAGPAPSVAQHSEPEIKIHDLGFAPKIKLEEGLKEVFSLVGETPKVKPIPEKVTLAPVVPGKLKFAFPRIPQKLPPKKIFAVIFLLLFLYVAKGGLDLYWGLTSLKSAQKVLAAGDFPKAAKKAKSARNSLAALAGKTKILTWPLFPLAPKTVKGANSLFKSLPLVADSFLSLAVAGDQLTRDLAIITGRDSGTLDLDKPAADLKRAYLLSSQAQVLLGKNSLPFVQSQIDRFAQDVARLKSLTLSIHDFAQLTADFSGRGQAVSYLILLLNNTELRPGGGFIGNFGLIEFEAGKLKNITVEDIYTIDGQLQEKIEPPRQLTEKLGVDRFYLRDSNWSSDFTLNAATARDFYKKETGQDVTGVIALDLTFVQEILKSTGGIKLGDYNETITADNLFEKGEYASEIGFFPGSTQKRDFFGALSRSLIAELLDSQSISRLSLKLFETVQNALREKHVLASFDQPSLASYVTTHGFANQLPPANFNFTDSGETGDFLSLTEANLGANKVNRFLDRKIVYEMTVGRDADLVAKLTVAYTNNSQAETWPQGKYVNFLRVNVPAGSDLFAYQNADIKDPKSPEITTSGGLTTFAAYVDVPVGSTREVIFRYRIPKNIKLEEAPFYHLYVQKQPGTGQDSLEFKFNLPAYLAVKSVNGDEEYSASQNLTLQTDLAVDRQFEIEVVKK